MHLIKSKKLRAFISILMVAVLLTISVCSVVAGAAPAETTEDPMSTFEPPVYEPTGCWAWSGGKLFLVSSGVILSISIIITLIQAKNKFKD